MTEMKKLTLKLKPEITDSTTKGDQQDSISRIRVVNAEDMHTISHRSFDKYTTDDRQNIDKNISMLETSAHARSPFRDTKDVNQNTNSFNANNFRRPHTVLSKSSDDFDKNKFYKSKIKIINNVTAPKIKKIVEIFEGMTVEQIANGMAITTHNTLKELKKIGLGSYKLTTMLDIDTAQLIVEHFSHEVKILVKKNVNEDPVEDFVGNEVKKPPVVTIVGHVDHGKTSLLDVIRNTNVVDSEAGGITQHIGAYQVVTPHGDKITFLDTPGHEAFTNIRARGVKLTDIVLLVIAADDGIKPQTIEAIKHIKQSKAEIIVVLTKIDKPGVKPIKVLEELLAYDIVTEIHSGDVTAVEVSALKGIGIDKLLETIALHANILGFKARQEGHAIGVVLETHIKQGFGHTANVLIQKGTLKLGDCFVLGMTFGKVKCLINANGEYVKTAEPGMPVSVIGLNGPAQPADRLVVVPNEQLARSTAQERIDIAKSEQDHITQKIITLEQLYTANKKQLRVIIKADTNGAIEALKQSISQIDNKEVEIEIIDSSIGGVTESDIILAYTSKSIIIGLNIPNIQNTLVKLASEKYVHIIQQKIIYRLVEILQERMNDMMNPVMNEIILGKAQIIQTFIFDKNMVAGCKVLDGKIIQGSKMKVERNGEIVALDTIKSLQKSTENAKEVLKDQECGIMAIKFHKYELNDIIICYNDV